MDTVFVTDTVAVQTLLERIASKWGVDPVDVGTIAVAAVLVTNWLKQRLSLGGWLSVAATAGSCLSIWGLLGWPAYGQIVVGTIMSTAAATLGWKTIRAMLPNGAPVSAAMKK